MQTKDVDDSVVLPRRLGLEVFSTSVIPPPNHQQNLLPFTTSYEPLLSEPWVEIFLSQLLTPEYWGEALLDRALVRDWAAYAHA